MFLRGALTSMVAGMFLFGAPAQAATNNDEFWDVPEPSENLVDALGYISSTPPTATYDATDDQYPVGAPVTMPDIASLAISLGASAAGAASNTLNTLEESVFRFTGNVAVKTSAAKATSDGTSVETSVSAQIDFERVEDPLSSGLTLEQATSAASSGTGGIPSVQPFFDGQESLEATDEEAVAENEDGVDADATDSLTPVPLPASGLGLMLAMGAFAGAAAMRKQRKNKIA
ncbi:MAG: hypothetical protein ABJM43_05265 [Paracoccaceae bacterium]